jgi:replicative DNA helicase
MTIDHDSYEKIICYKCITDAVYLSSISDYVKPEYFTDRNVAKYFEIVNSFYEKRHKLPTFTEIRSYLTDDKLKGGFKKLLESFKDIDSELDTDELYHNTEIFLKEKAVYHTMMKVAEEISDGKVDPSDILDKFETSCNINLVTDHGFELYTGVDRLVDDILNEDAYIPSNWEWFDDATEGGFREDGKALYVFAGQANVGKSIFLGNIAANIAKQNKTVLVISLEMSEMLYAKRIASNITKIPL